MSHTVPKQGEHEICDAVEREGLVDPLLREVVHPDTPRALADQLIATHVHVVGVLAELACNACVVSGNCPLESVLLERKAAAEALTTFQDNMRMLTGAPRWLAAARMHNRLADLRATNPKANAADILASFNLNDPTFTLADANTKLDAFLGGVTNVAIDSTYTKADFPELNGLGAIKAGVPLTTTMVRCAGNGHTYSVVDCTAAMEASTQPLSAYEEGLLASKMLLRMTGTGDKLPPIFTPDRQSQRVIFANQNGGMVFEMRGTGGKSRFYGMTVQPNTLFIFGGHSGDRRTQEDFIEGLKARQESAPRSKAPSATSTRTKNRR